MAAHLPPNFVGPTRESRRQIDLLYPKPPRDPEGFHAGPPGAGKGRGIQCEAAHGGRAERADIAQKWSRVDHLEVKGHRADLPPQTLEHLRQRLVPAAHAHRIEPGFTRQGIANHTQAEHGVRPVDDPFR